MRKVEKETLFFIVALILYFVFVILMRFDFLEFLVDQKDTQYYQRNKQTIMEEIKENGVKMNKKRINYRLEEPGLEETEEDFTINLEQSVLRQDNKIYFYTDIDRDKILTFNKELRNLDNALSIQNIQYNLSVTHQRIPIQVFINSNGGSLMDSLAAVDVIKQTRNPVHTIIDGAAASGATLMSVVGDQRFMNKHSYILIHQLSSGLWGTYENIKDDFINCSSFMKSIKDIYEEHCKIPKKKLKKILKHDLWFDAKTCLEYGLVDEIIT